MSHNITIVCAYSEDIDDDSKSLVLNINSLNYHYLNAVDNGKEAYMKWIKSLLNRFKDFPYVNIYDGSSMVAYQRNNIETCLYEGNINDIIS